MRRFFVLPENITGDTVLLSGPEAHHMRSVLRLQPGALIELLDGTGKIYHAEIFKITGNRVEGRITGHHAEIIDNPFPMTLAQGILKGKKMDLVLQKATELGVDTLIPMMTRYCEQRKNLGHRMQRWQRIMLEACKQCGRTTPMQITPVLPLQDVPSKSFRYPILCWKGRASPHQSWVLHPTWVDPAANWPGRRLSRN